MMKKFFLMALAVLAISFVSCSESTQKNDDIAAVVENLKAQLDAGDASALQSALESAKQKISELVAKDPETAKTYVVKVQEFLKENSEKIAQVVGNNAIAQGIVNTLVNAPAETVVQTLAGGQSLMDTAKEAVDSVQGNLEEAVQEEADKLLKNVGLK